MLGTTRAGLRSVLRHRGARAVAAVLSTLILVPMLASPGQALTPPSSSSFGISASVNLLGIVPLTVAPQAASAYPGGPATMNSGNLLGLGTLNTVNTAANAMNVSSLSSPRSAHCRRMA